MEIEIRWRAMGRASYNRHRSLLVSDEETERKKLWSWVDLLAMS